MSERQPIDGMIGEAFREVGILVFVFALLDKLVSGNITGLWTMTAVGVSAAFFAAGCFIERRRPID